MKQTNEKINVQASIFNLKVKGKPLELQRWDGITGHKPSSVRSSATSVASDNNRKYEVSVREKGKIIVTRIK